MTSDESPRLECECPTAISGAERNFVDTRRRMEPAWDTEEEAGGDPYAVCPLQRDHDGPHIAQVGATRSYQGWGDALSSWYITWGPRDRDPRLITPLAECSAQHVATDGTYWMCALTAGHPGGCRFDIGIVRDVAHAAALGIDLTPRKQSAESLDADRANMESEMTNQLVSSYLAGDGSYRELAAEINTTETLLEKLIVRHTTAEDRIKANALLQRISIARAEAEVALAEAETVRQSITPSPED